MSANPQRPLAAITGASTGIGLELARLCAANEFDLVICADTPEIMDARQELEEDGVQVIALQCDLSTREGQEKFISTVEGTGRPLDVLIANAGIGLGRGFLDQDLNAALKVVRTNIEGTIVPLHHLARQMRQRHRGRILVTGSIAGLMPGTFQAVYNGTKAFLDSFAVALNNELKDVGITVTLLQPGATETDFFERADLMDTKVGTQEKMAAADVARVGFDAMMKGELKVTAGLKNKLRAAMSRVVPDSTLAEMHRKEAAPGTGTGKEPKSRRERKDRPNP